VRHLLIGGIAAVVLLFGAIGGLYLRVDAKDEAHGARLTEVEKRLERIEGKVETEAAKLNGKLDLLLERKDQQATRR
jgi:hypothetical protein